MLQKHLTKRSHERSEERGKVNCKGGGYLREVKEGKPKQKGWEYYRQEIQIVEKNLKGEAREPPGTKARPLLRQGRSEKKVQRAKKKTSPNFGGNAKTTKREKKE